MSRLTTRKMVPHYKGARYSKARLPRTTQNWLTGGHKSLAHSSDGQQQLGKTLHSLEKHRLWRFPEHKVYFISDLHGDPEALIASLVASGGVKRTGPSLLDFVLTKEGKEARFVVGGDCFDKGPSSLGVIHGLAHLRAMGARVRLLAGNHDLRVFLGLASVGQHRTPETQHFFIRTGPKILPLLGEIRTSHVTKKDLKKVPSLKKCRRLLFPDAAWTTTFPEIAKGHLKPQQIKRELARIQKKIARFEASCADHGLTLQDVYVAALKWQDLFLHKNGPYHWFFEKLRLAYRAGSLLFVHAGVDNAVAHQLAKQGVKPLNRQFRDHLQNPPFDFYYGSLCNMVRTKYRDVDRPFDKKGVRHLHRAGISAIVHGHRNVHHGQRLATRRSILHVECDTSLDRHTRKKEKVRGAGAAVTIIDPRGHIIGISSDYPHVKVFTPRQKPVQAKPKPIKAKTKSSVPHSKRSA